MRLPFGTSPFYGSYGRRDLAELGEAIVTGLLIGLGVVVIAYAILSTRARTRPGVVEPPPTVYASGPTLTGHTRQVEYDDVWKVDHECAQLLGPAWPPGAYWMGCYDVRQDLVIVPAKGAWPSESERQELIRHEWAHARGWRHVSDGKFGRRRGEDVARAQTAQATPQHGP